MKFNRKRAAWQRQERIISKHNPMRQSRMEKRATRTNKRTAKEGVKAEAKIWRIWASPTFFRCV
jgi:hypothetical protein